MNLDDNYNIIDWKIIYKSDKNNIHLTKFIIYDNKLIIGNDLG